jgi:hypothetical protein
MNTIGSAIARDVERRKALETSRTPVVVVLGFMTLWAGMIVGALMYAVGWL